MKSPSSIHLHIDHLVLDGIPLNRRDGSALQFAIESELTRLLSEEGVANVSGGAVPHITAEPVQILAQPNSAHVGHQIANSIYSSITGGAITSVLICVHLWCRFFSS